MILAHLLTHAISRAAGWLARQKIPRPLRTLLWTWFARIYGVRTHEAAKPLTEYPSFLAMFTRRLRPDARPVADAPWVSPVDAWWLADQAITGDIFVPVKGNPHSLAQLLDDPVAPETYRGGHVAVFYLRPGDYHRIHSPCTWTIDNHRRVPGLLWPVNRLGQRVPGLFGVNERWIFCGTGPQGRMAMVWVGALMVGTMGIYHEGLAHLAASGTATTVAAGEELGAFHFGSTVIVVSAGPVAPMLPVPGEIRVGQAFWSPT